MISRLSRAGWRGAPRRSNESWSVTNTLSGWVLHSSESDEGVFNWMPKGRGPHEVKVAGVRTGLRWLRRADPAGEDPPTSGSSPGGARVEQAPASQALRYGEICLELHDYIVAAADSTGANGWPPLLVAAVMFMEAFGRPKDGSPGADAIRRKLAGESGYWPRRDAAWEKLQRFLGQKAYHLHLHDIREVELDLVREFFNEVNPVDRAFMGRKVTRRRPDRDDDCGDGHGRYHVDRAEREQPQGAA